MSASCRVSAPRKGLSSLVSLLGLVLTGALALGSTGCEDRAIGRPCDVSADAGSGSSATFNSPALECPSRICLQPAREMGAAADHGTAPYCTAACTNDSDCDDGERRDVKNSADRRCQGGFVCGVATETGPFKCRKVCLCKDFLAPNAGAPVPAACQQ